MKYHFLGTILYLLLYYYYYHYYCYSFFRSWFTTVQLLGFYLKPEATGRDIFYMLLLFFFCLFLDFYFALMFFVVAYIANTFPNMCTVLVSTTFCISARFCLPGIFSRCFAVPFFANPNAPATIEVIHVFNHHILSTSI